MVKAAQEQAAKATDTERSCREETSAACEIRLSVGADDWAASRLLPVIYGDLRIEDVSPERLAELEAE